MNAEEFYEYLKKRFNKTLAIFISKELQIITPDVLTTMSLKEVNNLARSVYPNLKHCCLGYFRPKTDRTR